MKIVWKCLLLLSMALLVIVIFRVHELNLQVMKMAEEMRDTVSLSYIEERFPK